MKLPGWLDVVLEGGALELQRALAAYRTLRRLHAGDWRANAVEVVDTAVLLQRREASIVDALERARRRAIIEPAARAVLPLVDEVVRERERLLRELGGGTMVTRLARFEEEARDVAWFALAFRRFGLERRALIIGGVLGLALVPFVSWAYASSWGAVPTLVDLTGLLDTGLVWAPLVALVGLTAVFWARLSSWSWLGVRAPRFGLPVLAGLLAMLTAVVKNVPVLLGLMGVLLAVSATSLALLAARGPEERNALRAADDPTATR